MLSIIYDIFNTLAYFTSLFDFHPTVPRLSLCRRKFLSTSLSHGLSGVSPFIVHSLCTTLIAGATPRSPCPPPPTACHKDNRSFHVAHCWARNMHKVQRETRNLKMKTRRRREIIFSSSAFTAVAARVVGPHLVSAHCAHCAVH